MIAFLRGKIISKSLTYTIIETGNVGYQVFGAEGFLSDLSLGSEVEVYLHHQVREEASDLYGFKNLADLELFELLLTVSGVGPKSALGILNLATASDIKEAIRRNDPGLLTKVSGVGKKTAERLILELKNKIEKLSGVMTPNSSSVLTGSDELDALMSLGYSLSEARKALGEVEGGVSDSGERVKLALRRLSGR